MEKTYNPITYQTKQFFTHPVVQITGTVFLFLCLFGAIFVSVNVLSPYRYAGGLKRSSARDIARQAVVNKYGISKALGFAYHGTNPGHVLGREAWISKWSIGKHPMCVYVWRESAQKISYVGRCTT